MHIMWVPKKSGIPEFHIIFQQRGLVNKKNVVKKLILLPFCPKLHCRLGLHMPEKYMAYFWQQEYLPENTNACAVRVNQLVCM